MRFKAQLLAAAALAASMLTLPALAGNVIGTTLALKWTKDVPFSGRVATFTDSDTALTPADLTATIDWGDGTLSTGTVAGASGSFTVSGSHTYSSTGSFPMWVIVIEAAGSTFATSLDGPSEVPSNASPATGSGAVALNGAQTQITMDLSFNNLLGPATLAHIHGPAAVGVNGPILFPLSMVPATTSGTVPTQMSAITQQQVVYLATGKLYYNVRSMVFPGGEIRGQLAPNSGVGSSPNIATIVGLAGSVPTLSTAPGVAFSGTVATFTDTVTTRVPADFIASIDWGDSSADAGTITGSAGSYSVTASHTYSAAGSYPVSVFVYELRFDTVLTASQEVPQNASLASGTGSATLNAAQNQVTATVSFTGLLSAANGAHIHGAAGPGTNAPIQFAFSGVPSATSGTVSPSPQTFAATPTQAGNILANQMYMNVHSTSLPSGEIRGQLIGDGSLTPLSGTMCVDATSPVVTAPGAATVMQTLCQ